MNIAVIAIVFACALYTTINRGIVRAFIVVFIPALLCLTRVEGMDKPLVLQLNATSAALYGILLGWPMSKERVSLKFNILDAVIILLSLLRMASGVSNGEFYTGVAMLFEEVQRRILPYFLARIAFQEMENRKALLKSVLICVAINFVLALIEVRLQPYFTHHMLRKIGVGLPVKAMAYYRFGFFRVAGTFDHPIYFGNAFLVVTGLVILLAKTTGRKLTETPIMLGIAGSALCMFFSLSFTPYIGVFGGLGIFFLLRYIRSGRHLLVPAVAVAVVSFISIAAYYAQTGPINKETGSVIEGSIENRKLIISRAWKFAAEAPLLGFGEKFEWPDEDSSLESVDNSYLVFAIIEGQLYMWTFISIAFIISFRAIPAFGALRTKDGIFGTSVALATVLGLMMAMFTVWAGAYYTVVWLCMLGFTNTLIDMIVSPVPVATAIRRVEVPQGRLGYR